MTEVSHDVHKSPERRVVKVMPTLKDVRDLANKTQSDQIEYGVSIFQASSGEVGAVYASGGSGSIFEPDPPHELRGKIRSGLFIHCHPIPESERVDHGKSLHILPSGSRRQGGDFAANMWSRIIGGYLNIASEYGLTMNIGIEGVSRDESVSRKLREKSGAHDLASEQVWKIKSGDKAGSVLVDQESREAVDAKFSIEEDIVLLSNTEPLGTRNFLHISWDKLSELEPIYGGFENLCFGDGLDLLLSHLAIDVKHDKNLGKATEKTYAMPNKRSEVDHGLTQD